MSECSANPLIPPHRSRITASIPVRNLSHAHTKDAACISGPEAISVVTSGFTPRIIVTHAIPAEDDLNGRGR